MGEQSQNENALCVVMECDNQAVFVAPDVEHGYRSLARNGYGVRVTKDTPHVLQALPARLANEAFPFPQRLRRVRVLPSKFAQSFLRDDAHFISLSPNQSCLHYLNQGTDYIM
jgi:hypothetical protein